MTEQERKKMLILADTIHGEINRICVTMSGIDMTVLSYQFIKEARAKIKRILENQKEENQNETKTTI